MNFLEIINPTAEERKWLALEFLRRAAVLYEEEGMWRDAAECWEEAGEGARAAGIYYGKKDYAASARLFQSSGRYEDALGCFEKWEDAIGHGNVVDRVRACLGISACLVLMGKDRERGYNAYMNARGLIEAGADGDNLIAGRCWEELGRYGALLCRSDLVQLGYEKALSFYAGRENGDRLAAAKAYLSAVSGNRLLVSEIGERIGEWEADAGETSGGGERKREPRYSLRSAPITVSKEEFKEEFGLNEDRKPLEYMENEYEDKGDGTVTDHATGLMWQQAGSDDGIVYADTGEYVKGLNNEKLAGYTDWRLPTIPELMSLLEPEKKNSDLYIDPVFDENQRWCWSSDQRSSDSAWYVYFNLGSVYWLSHDDPYPYHVRAVRP